MNIDYVLIKWILQAVVLNRPLNDDKLPHAQHPLSRVHLHNYLKYNMVNTYWCSTLVLVEIPTTEISHNTIQSDK